MSNIWKSRKPTPWGGKVVRITPSPRPAPRAYAIRKLVPNVGEVGVRPIKKVIYKANIVPRTVPKESIKTSKTTLMTEGFGREKDIKPPKRYTVKYTSKYTIYDDKGNIIAEGGKDLVEIYKTYSSVIEHINKLEKIDPETYRNIMKDLIYLEKKAKKYPKLQKIIKETKRSLASIEWTPSSKTVPVCKISLAPNKTEEIKKKLAESTLLLPPQVASNIAISHPEIFKSHPRPAIQALGTLAEIARQGPLQQALARMGMGAIQEYYLLDKLLQLPVEEAEKRLNIEQRSEPEKWAIRGAEGLYYTGAYRLLGPLAIPVIVGNIAELGYLAYTHPQEVVKSITEEPSQLARVLVPVGIYAGTKIVPRIVPKVSSRITTKIVPRIKSGATVLKTKISPKIGTIKTSVSKIGETVSKTLPISKIKPLGVKIGEHIVVGKPTRIIKELVKQGYTKLKTALGRKYVFQREPSKDVYVDIYRAPDGTSYIRLRFAGKLRAIKTTQKTPTNIRGIVAGTLRDKEFVQLFDNVIKRVGGEKISITRLKTVSRPLPQSTLVELPKKSIIISPTSSGSYITLITSKPIEPKMLPTILSYIVRGNTPPIVEATYLVPKGKILPFMKKVMDIVKVSGKNAKIKSVVLAREPNSNYMVMMVGDVTKPLLRTPTGTYYMDILIQTTPENAEAILSALKSGKGWLALYKKQPLEIKVPLRTKIGMKLKNLVTKIRGKEQIKLPKASEQASVTTTVPKTETGLVMGSSNLEQVVRLKVPYESLKNVLGNIENLQGNYVVEFSPNIVEILKKVPVNVEIIKPNIENLALPAIKVPNLNNIVRNIVYNKPSSKGTEKESINKNIRLEKRIEESLEEKPITGGEEEESSINKSSGDEKTVVKESVVTKEVPLTVSQATAQNILKTKPELPVTMFMPFMWLFPGSYGYYGLPWDLLENMPYQYEELII